jgi:hypothetical protein
MPFHGAPAQHFPFLLILLHYSGDPVAALPTLLKLTTVAAAAVSAATGLAPAAGELPVEVPLGREFVFQSIFACPVSKEQVGWWSRAGISGRSPFFLVERCEGRYFPSSPSFLSVPLF